MIRMRTYLLFFPLVMLSAPWQGAVAQELPNILFFFVDDMGWQDTSVPLHTEPTSLNEDYRTPHLERLAARGLTFTDAYACAICSPSRVSLMTGLNAARHGVTCWTLRKNRSPEREHPQFDFVDWPLNGLQPVGASIENGFSAVTLPSLLQEAGYHTIHAGKGHFGAQNTPGADPCQLGFTVNIAGSYMGGPGSYHGDKHFSAEWRGGDAIWDVPGLEKYHGESINLTEAVTREAISQLEQAVAQKLPFYLYMSHYAVHAPFEPNRPFWGNYAETNWSSHKKIYASMLEGMDRSLGDLLATLDRLEVASNTIVVFMSDNGSPRNNPQNLPLRGHKISGYEGGSRVPLVVYWPDKTPVDQRTSTPVIIEDIFPTFLEMARIESKQKIDGLSFVDILLHPQTDRRSRPLFWHYPNLYDSPPYSSVRLGDLKLIYWHLDQRIELFNLSHDIGERHDLAKQHPADTYRLAKILSNHLREAGALMMRGKASKEPIPWPDEVASSP